MIITELRELSYIKPDSENLPTMFLKFDQSAVVKKKKTVTGSGKKDDKKTQHPTSLQYVPYDYSEHSEVLCRASVLHRGLLIFQSVHYTQLPHLHMDLACQNEFNRFLGAIDTATEMKAKADLKTVMKA